jgi:hypothetical protein
MGKQAMTLKLQMERETAAARLYDNGGGKQWVPRSVCVRTLKFPPQPGKAAVHEVEIEDWWLAKNPWPRRRQLEFI